MKTWRDIAFAILNWISPSERMTMEEKIAYRRELELLQKGFTKVEITMPRPGPYEQPEPRTDPALQARLEAQKRKDAMKAFLHCDTAQLPKMPGELTRKYTTRKLDGDTAMLPKVPHKYSLSRYSGLYPDETEHRTPIFLQDKKIS